MLLSYNNSPYKQVTCEQLASYFETIVKQYNNLYSVRVETTSNDEQRLKEVSDAQEPIDPNDHNFKNLMSKVKSNQSKTK